VKPRFFHPCPPLHTASTRRGPWTHVKCRGIRPWSSSTDTSGTRMEVLGSLLADGWREVSDPCAASLPPNVQPLSRCIFLGGFGKTSRGHHAVAQSMFSSTKKLKKI